jgi:hypothetical protein
MPAEDTPCDSGELRGSEREESPSADDTEPAARNSMLREENTAKASIICIICVPPDRIERDFLQMKRNRSFVSFDRKAQDIKHFIVVYICVSII